MKNLSRTRLVVAGAIVGLGTLVGVGTSGAATPNPYPGAPSTVPPSVLTETTVQTPVARSAGVAAGAQEAGAPAANGEAQATVATLPFTGGDAVGLAAIGAVALAAGTAITVSRRRTAAV
jgi:hypothetical protein